MATKIKLRRNTTTYWNTNNPVLDSGEPCVGFNSGGEADALKIGPGAWNDLENLIAPSTGGGYTQEQIQDIVGAMFPQGTYEEGQVTFNLGDGEDEGNARLTLTDAPTVVWNYLTNNFASLTIAGNRTLDLQGTDDADTGILFLRQDATGGRTITLPGIVPPDFALASGANDLTVLGFAKEGGTIIWDYTPYPSVVLTTPVAPTVTGNDTTNILSASHAFGESEILVSENNGTYAAYAGPISVGNIDRAAGYWKFKIRAATGRNESSVANSPAFTYLAKTPVNPPTFTSFFDSNPGGSVLVVPASGVPMSDYRYTVPGDLTVYTVPPSGIINVGNIAGSVSVWSVETDTRAQSAAGLTAPFTTYGGALTVMDQVVWSSRVDPAQGITLRTSGSDKFITNLNDLANNEATFDLRTNTEANQTKLIENAINGHPAIEIATGKSLASLTWSTSVGSAQLYKPLTRVAVVQFKALPAVVRYVLFSTGSRCDFGHNGNKFFMYGGASLTGTQDITLNQTYVVILEYVGDGVNDKIIVNGVVDKTGNAGASVGLGKHEIGESTTNAASAWIGESAIYPGILGDTEKSEIVTFLKTKYGIA